MQTAFSIESEVPNVVWLAKSQPDVAEVDEDCILDCFPGRVSMRLDDHEEIALETAPVIGLVFHLSGALLDIKQYPAAWIHDVSGDFCLKLQERSKQIICIEEFFHREIRVPSKSFVSAAHAWTKQILPRIEGRFPRLLVNKHYTEIKALTESNWSHVLKIAH